MPNVGIKLRVAYPPALSVNSCERGNKFKNQASNAQAAFVFLFQCAAKPLKLCGQSGGTPTRNVSNVASGSG